MLGFGEAVVILVAGAVLFAGPKQVRARVQETVKFVRQNVRNLEKTKAAPPKPPPKGGPPRASLHTMSAAAARRPPRPSLRQQHGPPVVSSYRPF